MRKFQAGNLDRKIKILQKTKNKAPSGQDLFSWSTLYSCLAHIAPIIGTPGKEKNEDMGIAEMNKKTFLIRYKAGINTEMAIEYEAQHYNIKTAYEPPDTRRQWLLIETVLKL